jgi:L-fuculose-phosphate aldolase
MEKSDENELNSRHPELWDEPDFIRHELARTMDHIYSHGMTTTSGGNMSVADSLGNIWITPSGTDKGALKPDEVVCVAPDGNFEGRLEPSMEYLLHRAVYDARPDIRALIHAHPPMLTSFSIVHRVPDTSVAGAWRDTCGTAGYAGYAIPGSEAMAENVASEFMKGHNAVIMENHAVVTGGRDMAEALARLEALENCARTIHSAGFIGEIRIPESVQNVVSESHSGQLPGNSGSWPEVRERDNFRSPEEDLLADEISRISVRACNRGLIYGFCGTVSVRSSGNDFLITREGILRYDIGKEGIVRAGNPGSGALSGLHGEIYIRYSSVNAVITAQPPYLMAYAITGEEPDVRTIPESWLILRELPVVATGASLPGREEIFERLNSGSPAVIICNDSVVVTGENLIQAFDRLEVAEMTAMSLVTAGPLGRIHPIDGEKINDLDKKFPYKY